MKRKNVVRLVRRAAKSIVTDESERIRYQLLCVYATLGLISAAMTVLNFCTGKGYLTVSTLAFSVVAFVIFLMYAYDKISQKTSVTIFMVCIYPLFIYYIVSGEPDGFSILWMCLIPTCGLLLLGRKNGSLCSAIMFAILIFFFFTPLGRSLLRYDYGPTFTRRFPLLYTAFFLVGYMLETVRVLTFSELQRTREEYFYLSLHDALTGVYNRQGFNDIMDEMLAVENRQVSLLIIDIDFFKRVNDRFGHLQGDKVLVAIADASRKAIGDRGSVCRWGGEEFAVIVPDCGARQALLIAKKLRSDVEQQPIALSGGDVKVTVSIGVITADGGKTAATDFVNAADRCLYEAKDSGRNTVVAKSI